ncbi:hypothetical protein [Arthrobacter sp. Soil762]|uniref:hypothetical protein n=1 Tax=Arthrobacter sp. Soil762 TaxID=1736401 RepID=UPI0006F542AD|nr:hypothetical protein [Arthrobacter sp. Soil762]KRE72746.1 hypothetical protein ASG77_08770 [Arthrobacter sp. Soil762]
MYRVGGHEFTFKKDLVGRLSQGLKDYAGKGRVDDQVLCDVLAELAGWHPNAAVKFASGIEYWIVMPNNDLEWNTDGYRAVLAKGGAPEKFGYSKVLSPREHKYFVAEALTHEAIEITREFRSMRFAAGPVYCAETSELITDIKQAEAVHRRPRRGVLHEQFLQSQGLTYEEVAVERARPSGRQLVDGGLAQAFREYQTARLDGMDIVKSKRAS